VIENLLDGELVIDQIGTGNRATNFLIFDALVVRNRNVMIENFS
jgi:hypothetical protein